MECHKWKVRNEEVRRRAGIERELASRVDQRVLRGFWHVEKMDEYRMVRRVLMADTGEIDVRLDGWREDGLRKQRDDGGCATIPER